MSRANRRATPPAAVASSSNPPQGISLRPDKPKTGGSLATTGSKSSSHLQEIIQRLGRFPRQYEIKNEQGLSYQILCSRWGDMQNIAARYRRWLNERRRQEAFDLKREQQKNVFEDMPDAKTADVRWLRRAWQGMKVAFELHSSDFQGRPSHLCDLLVVLRHDWPACPVKVLELADILPQHKEIEPRESDTSFSPY